MYNQRKSSNTKESLQYEVRGVKKKYDYQFAKENNHQDAPTPYPYAVNKERKYSYLDQQQPESRSEARSFSRQRNYSENKENYGTAYTPFKSKGEQPRGSRYQQEIRQLVRSKEQQQRQFYNQTKKLQEEVNEMKRISDSAIEQLSDHVALCQQKIVKLSRVIEAVSAFSQGKQIDSSLHPSLDFLVVNRTQQRKQRQFIVRLNDMIEKVSGYRPANLKESWRWLKSSIQELLRTKSSQNS